MTRKNKTTKGHIMIKQLIIILLLILPSIAYSASEIGHKTTLTTDPKIREDLNSFDCTDKIFIIADLTYISTDKHTLKAIWINPSNETEQITKHKFQTDSTTYFGWLWLKLHPPTGGSILGGLSPNSGMSDYIGIWNVHLYLDDKKIDSKSFQVSC